MDAQSHAALAVAYREMGLYADAMREAAVAITVATTPGVAQESLRLLLTAPLLRPGGLEWLKRSLRPFDLASKIKPRAPLLGFVCLYDPRFVKLRRPLKERDYFAQDHVAVSYSGHA